MANATLVSTRSFPNRSFIKNFTTTGVNTVTTSSEIGIPINIDAGAIWGVKVSCASTNFDFRLYNLSGAAQYSTSDIFNRVTQDRQIGEYGLVIPFTCTNQILYFKLTNNDTSNITGTIYIELFVKED